MKVEYSYFGKNPSLVIKGTEFLSTIKNKSERYLLEVALNGFFAAFEIKLHPRLICDMNLGVQERITNSGIVIYTYKEYCDGEYILERWAEVYVQNGARLIEIVTSELGKEYFVNRKGI